MGGAACIVYSRMSGTSVAGLLIVATSVVLVCESAALGQVQTTLPPVGKFPGPCR